MSLGKQANILSKAQADAVLGYLAKTRYPDRNRVIFLLSAFPAARFQKVGLKPRQDKNPGHAPRCGGGWDRGSRAARGRGNCRAQPQNRRTHVPFRAIGG